jgi:xylose isomerase
VAAVNVNLKGRPEFRRGALTSSDVAVRKEAVALLREGKRLAAALGADRITCAPLADGYDYPFQTDYGKAWSRLVESVGEAAAFMPEIALHVEHKPADPRTRGIADNSTKVLWLCKELTHPTVGITFNIGHALINGGFPAAGFAQVLAARVPYYIHYCDGTPEWDWDLTAGARHYWQLVEFLFYLRQDGYQGWMTADTFPVRQDADAMFAANVRVVNRIWRRLESLDTASIVQALENHQVMPMMRELEQCFPVVEPL